ncbi:MAG: hypothetical protein HY962_15520 [Ignavibacteriae bacterium]|nr:hypothetical protein [Ignavibacteriota bacterium]
MKLLFNGYSAFFRNTFTFAVFEHTIVPRLTRISNETQHRELRVWSVGCAAGQESYSLAILLEEASAKEPRGLPYRMFATDLCKVQIAKAALGAYPEAALLTLTMERASEWFTVSNGMCVVNDVLKRNIEFSVFDVCNSKHAAPPGSIYGGFDVIMCSNLLMYYSSSKQDVIIDKLVAALNPGCYLIVGEAERSLLADRGYSEVVAYSAIFRP